jgi:hypothetical protein
LNISVIKRLKGRTVLSAGPRLALLKAEDLTVNFINGSINGKKQLIIVI